MSDEIDILLDQLFNERESYAALRDMYPEAHAQVEAARANIAALKGRLIETAIRVERQRCAHIVKAARFHQIETDLRSVISFIERGDNVEELIKDRHERT
jgi:hypothetical protein